jgi:hypothetical protein
MNTLKSRTSFVSPNGTLILPLAEPEDDSDIAGLDLFAGLEEKDEWFPLSVSAAAESATSKKSGAASA